MSRLGRKRIACLCLSALLFAQLALAAYACPVPNDAVVAPAAVAATQACRGEMDHKPANLCQQHCVQAAQSVDTQPQAALAPPLLPVIAVVVRLDAHARARACADRTRRAGAVDPPAFLRFGVLRI